MTTITFNKSVLPKTPHILEKTPDFVKKICNISDSPLYALLAFFGVVR